MMVHIMDCVLQGFEKIMLKSVDTDVVMLEVSLWQKMVYQDLRVSEF